ncbi:DNA mismatch repair endonuclease MutL [Oscillibacter sp.]|uniref:DNA mismatch repair endonuclease MutL n=1 Tax=Oscillibacter sp. TaxID=1945593 RepID=UPI00289B5D36|nr:DNA mismatch repair endonuclease MutL [Oscillibacter sp.]
MTIPHIQQLDPHVADLIAAGEVVERPASVVKELVENAVDAGASAVTVELQNGGMRLIRVTDDGCGIAREELPTAFLRHATSKLRAAEDLASVGTLGFRGEALAAIASVSRVEISSCRRGETGASLRLEGGIAESVRDAGVPEGTTIAVRDLFFNTPARLKFMKKDSAETAAVNGLMQHLALSHPEISFRFIKDGTEALHTPGDGKADSAIYAALGREFARTLTPVEGRGGEVTVSGFVTKPLLGRGSRSMQTFFVNGRFIKSQLLTAALEEGYRNQLMKGKFPGCVLRIDLPVTEVDVNVHPAKTTVKFSRDREVFDAVYHTVLDSLAADGLPQATAPAPETVVNPRGDFYQTMDAKAFRHSALSGGGNAGTPWQPAVRTQNPEEKPPALAGWNTERPSSVRVADSAWEAFAYAPSHPVELSVPVSGGFSANAEVRDATLNEEGRTVEPQTEASARAAEGAYFSQQPTDSAPAVPQETGKRPFVPAIPMEQETLTLPGERMTQDGPEAPWRIAGEVLKTYIVCEDAHQNVWLIDKHAAHERVNFDRLMTSQQPPMRQTLLRPVAAELSREDCALLLENLSLLESLGLACEDFGDGAVLVREVPADLDAADIPSTLEELAENLRAGRSPTEKRQNLLHTIACKAAIKAGWDSDESELRALVDKVQSGEIQYCPHGRPVKARMTKYELEKMFKRA